jgi:serine/threonine-protein kinase
MDDLALLARRANEPAADWGLRLLDGLTARHQRKKAVRVEAFLHGLAGLDREPEVVLDLVVAEWTLRRQSGDPVELAEYLRRFPPWEEELRMLWEVDLQTPMPSMEPPSTEDFRHGFPAWYVGAEALPATFGSNRLLQELGGGGMARIFLAQPLPAGKPVALKIPKLPLEQDAKSFRDRDMRRKRFLREASSLRKLNHPNLCRALDVGEWDGLPFFTMPYYPRGSVFDELKACGAFAQNNAARLVAEVARAMQHAHDLGMIHRDLKPSNLLRNEEGQIVVSDFGLAVMPDADEPRLTSSGITPGTPLYLSPEQVAGERNLTPASDIYSLGVIFYELLTGRPPFDWSNVNVLLRSIRQAEPWQLSVIRPDISGSFAAVCHKAMAKNPEDRHTSMRELAEDLERSLESTWTPSQDTALQATPEKHAPAPRLNWPKRHWLAAASLALFAVIGGLSLFARRDRAPTPSTSATKGGQPASAPVARAIVSTRAPIGARGLLQLLHDDLDQLEATARPNMCYFSLMEVHDNPYIGDNDFALHLDALSRVLNRVSHKDVPVYPVGSSGCLIRVDLRDLDWSEALEWKDILKVQPYGVRYDSTKNRDESLRKLAREIYERAARGDDSPIVRADWFVDAVTQGLLFDRLQRSRAKDRHIPPFDLSATDDPVARVAGLYRESVIDARVAAAELGLGTVAELAARWPADKLELRNAVEHSLPRKRWAGEGGSALFADCIRALGVGGSIATQPLD